MWATVIVGGAIGVYIVLVIRKRIKEIKAGKLCSCSCEDCRSSCSGKNK